MAADIETLIVGAGVIGLAVARSLAERGRSVLVLERHGAIGTEVSSRNSEVIHAGLYYPDGCLRARLCVAGKHLLYDFCRDNGVRIVRCGKLVVATSKSDIARLDAIVDQARRNGVHDCVALTAADAKALEPELSCMAALLSPSTGVIDSHGFMQALEGCIGARDGTVILNTAVDRIGQTDTGEFAIKTTSGGQSERLTAREVVLAAGLGASTLAATLTWPVPYAPPQTFPAKGHYFALPGRAPFRHLIYPIPDGAWLGIHLTLDVEGRAKFGPDIDWSDDVNYAFDDADGARRATFEREIRRYWPDLRADVLHPDYTGIRPKLYRQGEPASDFAIHGPAQHGIANLVALYGIESPGLTASLAIGEYVADLLS